ncbi:MAG: carbohydrate kinase family protein [Lachnospiraceae bacterium]
MRWEELDTDGIDQIFKKAQEFGAFTVADMNFDSTGLGPHGVDKVFPYTDYLMPSFDEAEYVTGKKDPDEIADYFLAHGVKNVVLKLGGEGCFFKNAEKRFYTGSVQNQTHGHDRMRRQLLAAFVHCLLKGMEPEECEEFACAAGALNSQGLGAHLYIESEQQILDFMKTAEKVKIER